MDSSTARLEWHFYGLKSVVPELRGLAILDSDSKGHVETADAEFRLVYWQRYEAENYFISPEVLAAYVRSKLSREAVAQPDLFATADSRAIDEVIDDVLERLVIDRIFHGRRGDFAAYGALNGRARELLWEARTQNVKLSLFAQEFFERLSSATATPVLLRKGGFHTLVRHVDPQALDPEVTEKLDLLVWLCRPDLTP